MRGFASVVAASLLLVSSARAEEAPETAPVDVGAKVAEVEASVSQHRKDKDEAALERDLAAIVEIRKAPGVTPPLAERLNSLLGTVLAGAKSQGLEKAGIRAIGEIGDPANVKHLKKYLRQPDPKVSPPLLNDAIEAAGKIKASAAIDSLLRVLDDSKVFASSACALKALGCFREERRLRARIFETMIRSVRRSKPGGGGGFKKGGQSEVNPDEGGYTSGRATGDEARWAILAPVLVDAANRLTGRTCGSAEDWFEMYEHFKDRLPEVFEGD